MTPCQCFRHGLAALALAAGMLGLSGCSVLGGDSTYPTRYTLDAGAATASPASAATSADYTLDLRPVSAPAWLDSKRMLYRLDYANDAQLAAYTRSSWADTPARLVGDNLGDTLAGSGLFAAVLGDASGRAALALQIELADFSQHFSSPADSHGRIATTATLLRTDNGRVIAQKRLESTAPANSAKAAAGVAALTQADTRLNRAIRRWLADTLADCNSACPAPARN